MSSRNRLMRQLGSVAVAVVLAGMILPSRAAAAVYSPPHAHLICSAFPGGLDTTSECVVAAKQLSTAGYTTFVNNDISIDTVMGPDFAQSDAILMISGHGNTGAISTYSSRYGVTVLSTTASYAALYHCGFALTTCDCNVPNACFTNYTFAQVHRIRFVYFDGCYTAQAPSYLLQTSAKALGVDSSLGFSAQTTQTGMNTYTSYLFLLAAVNGHSVLDSANIAQDKVFAQYGTYYGTDSAVLFGANVTLYSPGYGS